jgi:hypothetical protein
MASQGDPRVLAVINLVLSLVFSTLVVWGLDFIGLGAFTPRNVGVATVVLFLITWVVVLRQ